MILFLCSEHKLRCQERQPYMISGRTVLGLSGVQQNSKGSGQDVKKLWMADVEETRWEYIIIHHSATESGSVESIHEEHLKRTDAEGNRWLGIGYHFVIGNGRGMPDGTVQSTFRWSEQIHGAHSGSAVFNSRGIGICVVGNFEEAPPSKAQLNSLKALVKVLSIRHRITPERFMGHAAVKTTACPGKHFPLNEVRQVISETAH
jgi:N-acetyl-anhydromuramyl-L-alanine amidase AmpD